MPCFYTRFLASCCNPPSTYDNAALLEVYTVLSIVDHKKLCFVQISLCNSVIAAISYYVILKSISLDKSDFFKFLYAVAPL
jgi:hypothetical protein